MWNTKVPNSEDIGLALNPTRCHPFVIVVHISFSIMLPKTDQKCAKTTKNPTLQTRDNLFSSHTTTLKPAFYFWRMNHLRTGNPLTFWQRENKKGTHVFAGRFAICAAVMLWNSNKHAARISNQQWWNWKNHLVNILKSGCETNLSVTKRRRFLRLPVLFCQTCLYQVWIPTVLSMMF